jgi:chromosome segregation ATPase
MTPIQQQAIARRAKNEAISREIRDLENGFTQLDRALDEAADAGDKAEVERLMSDLAARKILLASARRRLEANKSGITAAEKVAAKKDNIDAAAAITVSLQEDVKRAEEIKATIDKLVQQLGSIVNKAEPARAHVRHLVLQLPKHMQDRYMALIREVGNNSTMLGSLIEEALLRARVFEALAPSDTVRLVRHGLPPLVDAYRNRAEKLSNAAHSLASTVNDGIE